jgi:hypothetical protein
MQTRSDREEFGGVRLSRPSCAMGTSVALRQACRPEFTSSPLDRSPRIAAPATPSMRSPGGGARFDPQPSGVRHLCGSSGLDSLHHRQRCRCRCQAVP